MEKGAPGGRGEITLLPDTNASWADTLRPVYLVCGEDERGIRDAVHTLLARHMPQDAECMDLARYDAQEDAMEEIVASLHREPMLSSHRIVVVDGCGVLRRRDRKADADLLAKAARNPGPRSCLILMKRPDPDDSRSTGPTLTAALDAAVREVGLLVRCPALNEDGLRRWLAATVRAQGKTIAAEALTRLVSRGNDRIALGLELDKVLVYVGERKTITKADVDAVVATDPEDVVFRLVDAVCGRRTGEALRLLRELARFETRSHTLAGRFLALLQRQLRFLYQARELMAAGLGQDDLARLPQEIDEQMPTENSLRGPAWRARNSFRDARLWARQDLVRAFGAIVRCDAANKGDETGSEDPLANLEVLIVRLCDRRMGEAATH